MTANNGKPHIFTLLDLGINKSGDYQLYDESCINEDNSFIKFDTQVAIVTHYLHTQGTPFETPYIEKAKKFIDLWTNSEKLKNYLQNNIVCESHFQTYLFKDVFNIPFPSPKIPKFTFIDLFAGIGGFRVAMQNLGGKCVFSSEWDNAAQRTYFANYGEVPFGDITSEETKSYIPDNFDVLCAGFPCQAFSIAGYRKGFEDTRGTLFFDVAEIIRRKRPKAVFLENVKNLCSHDNGKTFEIVKNTLEELGYIVFYKVMNAMEYANIPQNRERIFIICFDPEQIPNYNEFAFPQKKNLTMTIHDCIDYNVSDAEYFYTDKMKHYDELVRSIKSRDTIYQWRRQYVRENKNNVCPTLTANMGTGGHNVPLILTNKGIRKLTPKECLNFQGFPDIYHFPSVIAKSSMYKQVGNSVVVPLIQRVCKQVISLI
ncbi:MAG: DNA cytosine methyltransferase [Bacteroidales bacterium]|nr:DNA cytosine methyltransferase [Bacteroidales bacterium]